MKKYGRTGFICIMLICSITLVSCNKEQKRILNRLLKTETGEYPEEKINPDSVRELKEHVKKYGDEVEQLVKDTGNLGIYYKMLALEYLDQKMYGPAAEYFQKSLEIYPNNHVLHYYMALSQSQLAGARTGAAERKDLLEEAVFHHLRAAELKTDYFDALYAVSVLYVFELDAPLSAEEYILRALDARPGNINTLFLLARIRVIQGRFEEAVEIYDEIISESEESAVQNRARANREQLLGGGYNG